MIKVLCMSPEQWSEISESAHSICFGKIKPKEWDRIDFTLMVERDGDLMGYVTCRELDSDTLYWQFGGAFRGTRNSSLSFQGYQALIGWVRERYKRITTLIENENTVMLKMAMRVGFRIVGIRTFNGQVLLDHHLEFSCSPLV